MSCYVENCLAISKCIWFTSLSILPLSTRKPLPSKRKVVCAREKDLDDQKHHAKPKEIVMNNKSGNQDSTNNSLAHPDETLDNETLQATTHSGHNSRGQAKAQTELT